MWPLSTRKRTTRVILNTELSVDGYAMLLLSSADMISVPPLVRGRGGIYFDNNV